MAPKKIKGKVVKKIEKPADIPKGPMFTEVERTFLELQLTEANRKVARLRSTLEEYEAKNEKLQKSYDELDKDRADIITYLKKTLNNRNEEITELKNNVKNLEETKQTDTVKFKQTITEMERNFKVMKDQLTSEAKLLSSKLNTMEEFRITRDILMEKFERQEKNFYEQEMKYKRKLYDTEKKFVIGKDTLRKEMEGRLMQLAQDFQDNSGLRIAATTHRVIRENIAINNELENILTTQAKLASQNENYKKREEAARLAKELAEEERDEAIKKNIAHVKVIERLTSITQNIKKDKALMAVQNDNIDTLKAKILHLTKENDNLTLKVRILEQNLHGRMNDQNKSLVYASKVAKENKKLKNILKNAVISIQSALKLDKWAITDKDRVMMDREALLLHLLKIVTQYRDTLRAESIETLVSFEKVYEKGDLGFIPKPIMSKKSAVSMAPSITTDRSRSSNESFKWSVESASTTDLDSLKTMPSLQILPMSSDLQLPAKASLLSFVTSTKSNTSVSVEESDESDKNDIDKQLEQSKLEVQRAILKDLIYSRKRPSKLIPLDTPENDTNETKRTNDENVANIKMEKSVTVQDEIPVRQFCLAFATEDEKIDTEANIADGDEADAKSEKSNMDIIEAVEIDEHEKE